MLLENKFYADPKLCSRFQTVIGLLLYIMLGICLDITYAIIKLLQFSVNSSQHYLDKILYIC